MQMRIVIILAMNQVQDSPPPSFTTASVRNEPCASTQPDQIAVVDCERLFGQASEVILQYAGARYRLRRTRTGKLLLNK